PPQIGFDALHILDDGTFIAARGGSMIADSVLWEIKPVPDPVSGLAEIAVISLTASSLIVGSLTGLASHPTGGPPLVEVGCDSLDPIRADLIECSVLSSNMLDTLSFDWVFRPDSVIIFPGQDAPRFMPGPNVSGPAGPTATSWNGQIVTSGWIVVGA